MSQAKVTLPPLSGLGGGSGKPDSPPTFMPAQIQSASDFGNAPGDDSIADFLAWLEWVESPSTGWDGLGFDASATNPWDPSPTFPEPYDPFSPEPLEGGIGYGEQNSSSTTDGPESTSTDPVPVPAPAPTPGTVPTELERTYLDETGIVYELSAPAATWWERLLANFLGFLEVGVNFGMWGHPNRLFFDRNSYGSQAMLSSPQVQGLIKSFYSKATIAILDKSDPENVLVDGLKGRTPNYLLQNLKGVELLPALVGTFHYQLTPDYENDVLAIEIKNVTSIDSIAGHLGMVSEIPTSILTNFPFSGEQAFEDLPGTLPTDYVRAPIVGLPGGNVSQTFEIEIPLDYFKMHWNN